MAKKNAEKSTAKKSSVKTATPAKQKASAPKTPAQKEAMTFSNVDFDSASKNSVSGKKNEKASAQKNTRGEKKIDEKKMEIKDSAKKSVEGNKKIVNKNESAKNSSTGKAAAAAKIATKKGAAKNSADLFEDGLKDLYWAEKALTKALPKMMKNASSSKLKKAIETHLSETEGQIKRLEGCFDAMGKKAAAKKCEAMAGLLEEGKGIMEDTEHGVVRDAGIIMAAQKIEHYEIASYGTLAAFAKILEENECLDLLLDTLKEEKACDELLSNLADTELNSEAIKA